MTSSTLTYEDLIEQNLGLVHSCCHKLAGKGIEYDDLYGAGCVGLCKAAKGFEPERGLCFSTYAVPVILGEIRRLFRDGGSIKVSRSLKELGNKIHHRTPLLAKTLGREPTVQELADCLSVSAEQITEAMCAARPVLSLTVDDDGDTGQWDLPIDSCEEEFCNRYALQQILATLSPADRRLIELRYFESKTQTVVAQLLGMTQVQVSRRERMLLQKMRQSIL